MKLYITYNRYKFVFVLPFFLVLNGFVAFVVSKELAKRKIHLKIKDIRRFFKEIKKELKSYKNLTILDVKINNGVNIQLKLL